MQDAVNRSALCSDSYDCEKMHAYEICPGKDHRGVDLISDVLPFGRLRYAGRDAVGNAIDYAKFDPRRCSFLQLWKQLRPGVTLIKHLIALWIANIEKR
jgi:hypothetical protein